MAISDTHSCSLVTTPELEAGRASEAATPRGGTEFSTEGRQSSSAFCVCVNWRYFLTLKRIDVLLNWPLSEEMVATNNLDWPLAMSVN